MKVFSIYKPSPKPTVLKVVVEFMPEEVQTIRDAYREGNNFMSSTHKIFKPLMTEFEILGF